MGKYHRLYTSDIEGFTIFSNTINRDFRHINGIIENHMFMKVYLNNNLSLWVFILCDGEYGFFDGYSWYDYIPRSIAEFMGEKTLKLLQGGEFKECCGRFII